MEQEREKERTFCFFPFVSIHDINIYIDVCKFGGATSFVHVRTYIQRHQCVTVNERQQTKIHQPQFNQCFRQIHDEITIN